MTGKDKTNLGLIIATAGYTATAVGVLAQKQSEVEGTKKYSNNRLLTLFGLFSTGIGLLICFSGLSQTKNG